jgi:hypothetical protein
LISAAITAQHNRLRAWLFGLDEVVAWTVAFEVGPQNSRMASELAINVWRVLMPVWRLSGLESPVPPVQNASLRARRITKLPMMTVVFVDRAVMLHAEDRWIATPSSPITGSIRYRLSRASSVESAADRNDVLFPHTRVIPLSASGTLATAVRACGNPTFAVAMLIRRSASTPQRTVHRTHDLGHFDRRRLAAARLKITPFLQLRSAPNASYGATLSNLSTGRQRDRDSIAQSV